MFHFVLVVWYGLVNVPGLFEMCRDCLKCAGTVWNVPGLFEMCRDCLESEISNSPGTLGNF